VLHGQTDLLEVVETGSAPRSLSSRLHGGKQEGDEDANDGDDDQEFNERETM
jgi:hypothetical protein